MSFFDTAHEDRTSAAASAGPRLGFFGAMEVAYDAQVRAWSLLGVSAAFEETENEQIEYIREQLGDVPELEALRSGDVRARTGGNFYEDLARFYEDGGDAGSGTVQAVERLDQTVAKLKERLPELLTYRELWGVVKARATSADHRWAGATTSWPGMVGGFIGGAGGAMDPRTDPVNTLTMGVGGVGATLLRRLAIAGGSNALAESVNQATGIRANRELLGLEHSADLAMKQILFAGTVGVAFQGAGEFIAAGARRLRGEPLPPPRPEPGTGYEPLEPLPGPRDLPPDVAGRVPAWAASRPGPQTVQAGMRPSDLFGDFWSFAREVRGADEWADTSRGMATVQRELDRMTGHLERWDVDGLPPTDTRVWSPPLRADVEAHWSIRAPEQVRGELGRHYDPDLYRELDQLDADMARLRGRADELRQVQQEPRSRAADQALDRVQELQERIDALQRERSGVPRNRQRQIDKAIKVLNGEQRETLQRIRGDAQRLSDAQLEAVSVSQRLAELQARRQQLTPLQRHAEDVARGVMDEHMPSADALILYDRLAAYGVDITPPIRRASQSDSPAVQRESLERPTAQPGESPAETVTRTVREDADQLDDGDVLLQRVREALGDAERTDVQVGDTVYPVDPQGVRQSDFVTVLDFAEQEGARFAQVRQQDGTISFWPADRLERVATVDLGRGPMVLDQAIAVGVAEDGSPSTMTVRDILRGIDDDEAMIRAMTACGRV